MTSMPLVELIGYLILALLAYKFILNSLTIMLDFIAKRTANKLDDDMVSLIGKLAEVSKKTIDSLRV